MAARKPDSDDLDSPWKEALEHFLAQFLAFFYPAVHADIDWNRGYESLDKELQQVAVEAQTRRRIADKLFKVWLKDGSETWLLIHVEVQGKKEETFPERMFIYGYRIYDLHRVPVVSLAVLCDANPSWRPDGFEVGRWGSSLGIHFLPAKLMDYQGQEVQLETMPNPFSAIVLAQLTVLTTRQSPTERWRWKVRLVKGLYDRGLSSEQIRQLFRLIDWMVQLPEDLEDQFWKEIHQFEEGRRMPYVTSVERIGMRKGVLEGWFGSIEMDLELKFGSAGKKLMSKVRKLDDLDQVQAFARAVKSAETLDEVKQHLS